MVVIVTMLDIIGKLISNNNTWSTWYYWIYTCDIKQHVGALQWSHMRLTVEQSSSNNSDYQMLNHSATRTKMSSMVVQSSRRRRRRPHKDKQRHGQKQQITHARPTFLQFMIAFVLVFAGACLFCVSVFACVCLLLTWKYESQSHREKEQQNHKTIKPQSHKATKRQTMKPQGHEATTTTTTTSDAIDDSTVVGVERI